MNEMLVKNWNETVMPDDIVYYLGDFSMAFRPVETFSNRLNGIKYLIPGNHDFCHSYHKKSRNNEKRAEWVQKYINNGWLVLPEQTTLDIEGVAIVNMCHHPYDLVHESDDKYAKWRPHNDGRWLLCGHVHEKWKLGKKMINVGCDVWNYRPVSIEQIKEIILNDPS